MVVGVVADVVVGVVADGVVGLMERDAKVDGKSVTGSVRHRVLVIKPSWIDKGWGLLRQCGS